MFQLPKGEAAQVRTIDHLRATAEGYANIRKCEWLIAHHWLQGIRDVLWDYRTGQVQADLYNRQTESGRLDFRYEVVLPLMQAELGRLMRMDIRPWAERRGFGLDTVRKASAARVILDYLTSPTDWDRLKSELFYSLVAFGTVGVGLWTHAAEGQMVGPSPDERSEDLKAQASRLVLEPILPAELLPIPYNPDTPAQVEGIMRRRWVPLDWLRKKMDLGRVDKEKLRVRPAPYGVRPGSHRPLGVEAFGVDAEFDSRNQGRPSDPQKVDADYVLLEEVLLLQEERDRLGRYIVKVGDSILHQDPRKPDEVFDRTTYCPLAVARYYPTGGFYGRSWLSPVLPLVSEMEEMAQNLFQNVKDVDLYGMTLFPLTWGVNKEALLSRKQRRKVEFYSPDIAMPEADLKSVSPFNAGEAPGRTLAYASKMLEGLANQSEMLRGEAPGRVDSEAGLNFLYEQNTIPLSVPAGSVADCMSQVYKAVLGHAPRLLNDRSDIPLIGLDDSLIGLSIDQRSGRVQLAPENFPGPWEVQVGVRDRLPVSPTVREQKLIMSHKMGLITPLQFRIICWKENIDFPVGNWAQQESYRKAVLQCLLLFHDGQTPGPVIGSAEADLVDVHLEVIQAFMAKSEFQFASPEVRQAFEQLKAQYLGIKGSRYPQQLPYPEDAAELEEALKGGSPRASTPIG